MKFRCKQSGNVFEFKNEHDIKTMLTHPEYEEVKEQEEPAVEVKKSPGRPKKQLETLDSFN